MIDPSLPPTSTSIRRTDVDGRFGTFSKLIYTRTICRVPGTSLPRPVLRSSCRCNSEPSSPSPAVAEGDRIQIGKATLAPMHTPGHTGESTSFVLNDAAAFLPVTLCSRTGWDVRISTRTRKLPVTVPALCFTRSFACGSCHPHCWSCQLTRASQLRLTGSRSPHYWATWLSWLSTWLASESGFVERVTSQLPPTPPNFVRIVELNESGDVPDIDATDLEAGANRCAVK